MFHFPQIAATAKRLSIGAIRHSAIKDGDDVVEFKMFRRFAVGAFRSGPFSALKSSELLAMPSEFWRFVVIVLVSTWQGRDAFFSKVRPFEKRSHRNALAGLIGMVIAQSVLIPHAFAFARHRDSVSGFNAMGSIPERVSVGAITDSHALLRTGFISLVPNLGWRSVEFSTTHGTKESLSSPRINPQFASIANAVNSGKHLNSTPEYKSILSQAQAGMLEKVQRLEAETRTVGNASTSAAPERDDIVRAAWRRAEAGVKFRRDNTTDDVMNTTPMDGITSAFFDWAQMAVSISISRKEERQNSGEARQMDLLEEKTNQAMDAILELFAKGVMQGNGPNTATAITTAYTSPMNGSLFVPPLPLLVAHTPSSGTIGSVSAGNSWWQNQAASTSITTYAGLLKALDHMRNLCKKGVGGAPDINLVDQATEEVYVAALRNQNRYTDTTRADIPFTNIAFYGQPVVWDEFMPNWAGTTTTQSTTQGTWLMLNSKFIHLKYDAETNFITTPFIRPENQDAKTAQILWMGTLGVNNRRKHGVEDTIDTTITS